MTHSTQLEIYSEKRNQLLEEIIAAVSADDRFVAAWLTGSYSRGNHDAVSDIDINVVVSGAHSDVLCHRPAQISAETTPERMALFSQFGDIAFLHENSNNAPEGGTFTNVIYANTAVIVDWIVLPQKLAKVPSPSTLLFDIVGIPKASPAAPETLAQRAEKASEITSFIWLMLAMITKYLIRGDAIFAIVWTEHIHSMLRELRRLVADKPFEYRGGSLSTLNPDYQSLIAATYQMAAEIEALMPEVEALGGFVRPSPMATLEVMLQLAKEKHGVVIE